jgi:hypothetical protein
VQQQPAGMDVRAAKRFDPRRALPHLCNNNLPAWMYEPQSGLTRAARCPS